MQYLGDIIKTMSPIMSPIYQLLIHKWHQQGAICKIV